MTEKYLLLDVDDTIAPLMYRGLDAVEVSTFGLELAIPRYIVDWLIAFSKKENHHIIWCTDRGGAASLISKNLGFKVEDGLTFGFNTNHGSSWKKLPAILQFAQKHPEDIIICADNDAWRVSSEENTVSNLHFLLPTGNLGCLSQTDLEWIETIK